MSRIGKKPIQVPSSVRVELADGRVTVEGTKGKLTCPLPEGVQVAIERDSWPIPPVFTWLQRLGEVDQEEMEQVFNMGVGLAMIVSPYYAESIRRQLKRDGLQTWFIGRVRKGPRGVVWGKV